DTVSVCGDAIAFDLFASLQGTPETGGSWTDLTGSGASITGNLADFTGVASGTYEFEYSVAGAGACTAATATVTVNVSAPPSVADAGPDQVLCGTFFTDLNATPPTEGSGSWLSVGAQGLVIDQFEPN